METYPAIAVANYFVEKANRLGEVITNLKVQKLLYFAHGWTLALARKPLIADRIQAWKNGPVVPLVYHAYKGFGRENIPMSSRSFPIKAHDRRLLDDIYRIYGPISAENLSELTHDKGSPWHMTYDQEVLDKEIANGIIQDYFFDLSRRANGQ